MKVLVQIILCFFLQQKLVKTLKFKMWIFPTKLLGFLQNFPFFDLGRWRCGRPWGSPNGGRGNGRHQSWVSTGHATGEGVASEGRSENMAETPNSTLSSISMVQWKIGPSNMSFLSFMVIFHFHDYGRKGIYGQICRKPCKTWEKSKPLETTRRWGWVIINCGWVVVEGRRFVPLLI